MEMTNEEIVRSYRQAEDPRRQIRILSELNAVKQSVIAEILRTAGETVPSLRGRARSVDAEKEAVRSNAGVGIEITNAEAGGVLPDVAALQEENEPRHAATERMQEKEPRHAATERMQQLLGLLRETDPPQVQRDIVLLASALFLADARSVYVTEVDYGKPDKH